MNYEDRQRPRGYEQGDWYSNSQRQAYRAPEGAHRGAQGGAYRASQGSAYRGAPGGARRSAQGSTYRASQGGAYRSAQGSARRSAQGSTYRSVQGSTYRGAQVGSRAGSHYRMQQKRRLMQQRIRAVVLLLLLIAMIVILANALRGCSRPDPTAQAAFAPTTVSTQEPLTLASATPEATPTPTPTPEPTPTPNANAAYRPVAENGLLPVFKKSETQEKIIAITVDDCYQAKNLANIVQLAIDYGGKLTIFPIGENALKDAQAEALRYAWQNGFELENHTMTHNSLYAISDEDLAREVYYQNLALSKILGVEYQAHFLRPRGGDARNDQRMQAYARQMGYYGIAHWSYSGSDRKISEASLQKSLKPGNIYLFHTTDTDLKRLRSFIPYAVSQGYRLVTLNEMFGYPANETAELTQPIEGRTPPALEPYTPVPVTYKETTFDHGVIALQEQLIALGYLNGSAEGAADGVYGKTCAGAVSRFQSDHGMTPTGKADPETQARIAEAYNALNPAPQAASQEGMSA